MSFLEVHLIDGIATVILDRGKVNALNPAVIEEMSETFSSLKNDSDTRGVVLTGRGSFFSFGFDIPEFLSYTREEFTNYLRRFTSLYRDLFLYPKPLVAALNGHAIAGGCMIALACDRAIMVDGTAKISLNEITFGSSVFAGSVQMLQFGIGSRASEVLYSGAMYSGAEAYEIGLVAELVDREVLISRAQEIARELGSKRPAAFASIKLLMRKPVADEIVSREAASIDEFVDIWYSEPTSTNLRAITIR